ncbi:MAG: selenocysteine-specific translation elongation factor, partial [Candidatus Aquilonibacter sp.]
MHIIGTAGHVDHGKSSLVQALTGTNPDRWLEEQVRGMTLDLGFAHLRFDDGIEAGIVDVPGHERFLHNMLAGAAGMELLLLVIAADDGVMPQTLEHLQILRYLNVKKIVVALTKIDLIPPQEQGLACQRVHAQLAGTIARDAFIFAVSTVTGANLDVLKEGLHQELAALAPRDPDAPAYLPIDRVFALAGRGTIVTGTLMQGRVAVGDTVALQPLGAQVRVRSLHVFGTAREAATGGTRVALNLPGIDRTQIAR